MAFQPIVDVESKRAFGYEALVRGVCGESAATVLEQILPEDRYAFDAACRVAAIEKAAMLGMVESGADLFVNLYANALGEVEGDLQSTTHAAATVGLSLGRVVLEISEKECLRDPEKLEEMLAPYRREGLRTAIDDFGAGFAGLSMLAVFQPDLVKIDLALTTKIHERRTSQVIVRGIGQMCAELGIDVIAEGVEEAAQKETLRELGVRSMQGNLFARPGFEALPVWPGAGLDEVGPG